METIIEKDSPVPALVLLGGIFLLLVAGALGLAYAGGVFTGKDAVAANDKRIAEQAMLKPGSAIVPESAKH
jgi:hypothetical protein